MEWRIGVEPWITKECAPIRCTNRNTSRKKHRFSSFLFTGFVFEQEACSCSYGITEIKGCEGGDCWESGGSTLSYQEGIYEELGTGNPCLDN